MIVGSRYQIVAEIGAGGMGMVYRGLDLETQQTVAIKSLKPDLVQPDSIERFKREGEALRQLNHPNIVKLLDMIETENQHYLVMEYVSGGDLNNLMKQGQIELKTLLRLAIDLADALTRAHRLNIIHRDLKPANVLITGDGLVRLSDFGIALSAGKPDITHTDAIMGTLDYMPPEAFSGETLDNRADIWAFGVMLYEMLTHCRPFTGNSFTETLYKITTAPIPDLEVQRPDIPTALVDLVYRMLERDRQARIASVRHVGAALEDLLYDRQPSPTHSEIFFLPQNNLPVEIAPFIGREAELIELHRLFDLHRAVTIAAPGGMGKTRLALEFGHRVLDQFFNGVYLVDLTPLTEISSIPLAIADAVGYQFHAGNEPRQQLIDYLREKNTLLILDNFEHLIQGVSIVTDILQAAPAVKILATSRERLKLTGEQVFDLGGMQFPDSIENALEYSAVKLFIQSARRVRPDFELKTVDLAVVAEICRLVEGLPLGILLAASWMEMLSLREIADEIRRSIDFLETEMRDVPQRQRSIRAVFDYSWNLLTDTERQAFVRLSVFHGGFTRDAAEKITGASLRTLMSLMSKSLLRRDPESGRYQIHELLRQYAEIHLQTGDTQHNHSVYYLKMAHDQGMILHGKGQQNAMQILEADYENIRAAWYTAIREKNIEALSQAAWMRMFYEILGWYEEGKTLYEDALKMMPDALEAASILSGLCMFAHRLDMNDLSEVYSRQAIDLLKRYNRLGDDLMAMINLGHLIRFRDPQAGEAHYRECLQIAIESKNEWGIRASIDCISFAMLLNGEYDQAKTLFEQEIAIARQDENLWGLSFSLRSLGVIYHNQGDMAKAKAIMLEALENAYKIKQRLMIEEILSHLMYILLEERDYDALQKYAEQSRKVCQNPVHLTIASIMLGFVALERGDFILAEQHYLSALRHWQIAPNEWIPLLILKTELLLLTRQHEKAGAYLGVLSKYEQETDRVFARQIKQLHDRLQVEDTAGDLESVIKALAKEGGVL